MIFDYNKDGLELKVYIRRRHLGNHEGKYDVFFEKDGFVILRTELNVDDDFYETIRETYWDNDMLHINYDNYSRYLCYLSGKAVQANLDYLKNNPKNKEDILTNNKGETSSIKKILFNDYLGVCDFFKHENDLDLLCYPNYLHFCLSHTAHPSEVYKEDLFLKKIKKKVKRKISKAVFNKTNLIYGSFNFPMIISNDLHLMPW